MFGATVHTKTAFVVVRIATNIYTCVTKSWCRNHVVSDLRAYVCLWKDCDLRSFCSKARWIDHMDQHYVQWRCLLCTNNPFKSYFELEKVLEDHVRSQHPTATLTPERHFEKEPRDTISGSECMFCDWEVCEDLQVPGIKDRPGGEKVVYLEDFYHHVEHHLEQIAVLPLERRLFGPLREKHNDDFS